VLRGIFSRKKAALAGAPAVRRMKTYSAQSGYVYQYFYEGHRDYRISGDAGIEYVFSVSADRKTWSEISVMVGQAAVHDWEQRHSRELSPTERYAISKIALFQAFDERAEPSSMKDPVLVRPADVEAIVETLGL
jgi:hypothetical protein